MRLVWIAILLIAIVAVASYFRPAKIIYEQGEAQVRAALNIDGYCPDGWERRFSDSQGRVSDRCIKDNIVVHLTPNTKFCNWAKDTQAGADAPNAGEIACKDVPDWPADRVQ